MDTYSMISGNDAIKLPSTLWTYFIRSLDYLIAYTYNISLINNDQVWINIPNNERVWMHIDELKDSIFSKQKDIIGLDFNLQNPIISNGKYWSAKIEDAIDLFNDINTSVEGRNIYVFDKKLSLLICYLYESNGILIWGKNKNLILKK